MTAKVLGLGALFAALAGVLWYLAVDALKLSGGMAFVGGAALGSIGAQFGMWLGFKLHKY